MQFGVELISPSQAWLGWAFALVMLSLAVWRAPWKALLDVPTRQHALLMAWVILCLIWSFRFQIVPGLHFHPVLMVTLTLVFGWPFAVLTAAAATGFLAFMGEGHWFTLPWDWLFSGLIPASLAAVALQLLAKIPTRNLFAYILGVGFFGTLIITALNGLLLLAFLAGTQPDAVFAKLWEHFLFIVPLLYAESFINGVLVTAVTVYRPELVKTFDEERFLKSAPRK